MKEGWKCPGCNVVWAPHINQCNCQSVLRQLSPGGVDSVKQYPMRELEKQAEKNYRQSLAASVDRVQVAQPGASAPIYSQPPAWRDPNIEPVRDTDWNGW